jgi:(p)ppGpp synthase/HD superfamily hydrolase
VPAGGDQSRVRAEGGRARRLGGEAKSDVKRAYLERLRHAPAQARLVKLADRASNVQTLRNLAPDRQRRYFAQTVTYIVPLAAMDPWFARWYAAWQQDFADLG